MLQKQPPPHYELLSEADKDTYQRLFAAISAPSNRNKKNKRADDFQEIIDALCLFINHDEEDRWKRCLVCGLFPFEGGMAVNTSALKKLILKCKSSINGSFKAIGYPNVTTKSACCQELLNGIPFLKNNFMELRQWTVRFKDSTSIKLLPANHHVIPHDVTPPVANIKPKDSMMSITISDSNFSNQNSSTTNQYFQSESISFGGDDDMSYASWFDKDADHLFDFL